MISADVCLDEGYELVDAVDQQRRHNGHAVVLATQIALVAKSYLPQIVRSQKVFHAIREELFLL